MHTPGPWKWSEGGFDPRTHRELHEAQYEVGEGDSIVYHGANWPMTEANARLIAAAPDLLEACEAAIKEAGDDKYVARYLDLARAAIAKAKDNA
jgi:L-fucose mutarotase/ribose pyranase (RbsD/FucU family)